MKQTPLPEVLTQSSLMLWFMHRLTEEFGNSAILKGGMEFALLDSQRMTNDLDYVFVPFRSKKQIEPRLKKIANEIPSAHIETRMTSKNLQMTISLQDVALQIEANVAMECKSEANTTQSLARPLNTLPKAIRMMSLDVALAHKLAAWNERRLFRDLYDCYFLFEIQKEFPELNILKSRLKKIQSRHPKVKSTKQMSLSAFLDHLKTTLGEMTQKKLDEELRGILPADERQGLVRRLRTSLFRLTTKIENQIADGRS